LKRLHGSSRRRHERKMTSVQKASLRREALERRSRLAAEAPDAADRLVRGCGGLGEGGGLKPSRLERLGIGPGVKVAGYWPIGSEIDPRNLMRAALEAGAVVLLPVILGRTGEPGLEFRVWTPSSRLASGPMGVQQPDSAARVAEPDVVLTPLLAFDRLGRRLGYGGGYYDRTLRWLRRRRSVLVAGLAYSGQEVAATPAEPWDERLDAVLTETAFITIDGAAK